MVENKKISVGDNISYIKGEDIHGWEEKGYGVVVSISNEVSYPILTMFSGGLVNIFVPSGGGQWAVQGPIILQSALELGIDIPKSIMALAYGELISPLIKAVQELSEEVENLKAER